MVDRTVSTKPTNIIYRLAALIYGLTCYAICCVTILYACGFVGNIIVPRSIDSAPIVSLGHAFLVNTALLGFFGLQHSGMARPAFKQKWTQVIPMVVERSTYVLVSSLCWMTLFYFWQPMGGMIWQVDNGIGMLILYSVCAAGWLTVFAATFLINHFDVFGVRQVWLYLRGKDYTHLKFVTPGLYKLVRHPLYFGFIVAFWATPIMTVAHLVFALITTVYILVAVQLEEQDLVSAHGQDYENYRRRVPMIIPFLRPRQRKG